MPTPAVLFALLLAADDDGSGSTITPEAIDETTELNCFLDEDDHPAFLVDPPLDEVVPYARSVAAVGGRWWIVQEEELLLANLDESIVVDDDSGQTVTVYPVYDDDGVATGGLEPSFEPSGDGRLVVGLEVPPGAAPGGSFAFRAADGTLLAEMTVSTEPATPPAVTSLTVGANGFVVQPCEVRCDHEDQAIPRLPVVAVDYAGDPAPLRLVVTAACTAFGGGTMFEGLILVDEEGPREVVDPTQVGARGDCELWVEADVLDPHTGQIVESFSGALGPLEAAPRIYFSEDGTELETEPCGPFAGTALECVCSRAGASSAPASAGLLIFGALTLMRASRRRHPPR